MKHTFILEGVAHPDLGKTVAIETPDGGTVSGKLHAVHLAGTAPLPGVPQVGPLSPLLIFTVEQSGGKLINVNIGACAAYRTLA